MDVNFISDERLEYMANDSAMCNISVEVRACLLELQHRRTQTHAERLALKAENALKVGYDSEKHIDCDCHWCELRKALAAYRKDHPKEGSK